MPEPDPGKLLAFETPEAFGKWLENNHATEKELWVKFYKKASGKKTITWEQSVIEALIWGWIDGIRKSWEGESYVHRFTPRRKKSNWSKINRQHVERLLKDGRMQEPGMVHVRAAQEDGRWEAAYAPQSQMEVPGDFLAAVAENPKAQETFDRLNKQYRFGIAYQLQSAKRPETRGKHFRKYLGLLAEGKMPF